MNTHATCIPRMPLSILMAVWLLILTSTGSVYAQQPIVNQDSLQATFTLSELMSQAEDLTKQVSKTMTQLQDTTLLASFRATAAALNKSVSETKEKSDLFLQSTQRDWLVQGLFVKWSHEDDKSKKLNDELSEAIKKAEAELQKTQELRKFWSTTRADVLKSELGKNLNKPLTDLLLALRNEEKLLQQIIRDYLRVKEGISANRLMIDTNREALGSMLSRDFSSYLLRNETFLWQRASEEKKIALNLQIKQSFNFALDDIHEYIRLKLGLIVLILAFGIMLYLVTLSVNKKISAEKPATEPAESAPQVIPYPGIYAYTITLILALVLLKNRPFLFTEFVLLLFSASLLLVIILRSQGIVRVITLLLLLLYWSNKLTDFFILDNHFSNAIDLLNAVLTTVLLALLYYHRKLFRQQFPQVFGSLQHSLLPILLTLSSLSVLLHLIGFTSLAHLLINGTLSFIYVASVILMASAIVRDLLQAFAQTELIKNSVLAQHYYASLFTVSKAIALYLLFMSFITGFALRPALNTLLENMWNFGGQFGAFTITVGDVLGFILILLISWTISVITGLLLEGEILSRFNMRRGVAMAIGVLVRYFIIVLGFLLAMATTGFDLTKISILAGALGVGIGFGLQNLVANFISGLILIFERPFVVNDTIETDQIEGTVKEIGLRSSKILTYDGAEVIIPNSNLISNRLSNYTLSNASRRQLIIIRTSIQADPDEVIKILLQLTRLHPNILDQPEPFVLFDGQVEQTLQFKLYYWLISDMFKTRSELNLQIYRELKSLGVELPVPVHEIISREKNSKNV